MRLLSTIVLLTIVQIAVCQEKSIKTLSIASGALHDRFVDEKLTANRQLFTGTYPSISARYTRSNNKSELNAGLHATWGKATVTTTNTKAEYDEIVAHFEYLWKLNTGSRFKLSAGLRFQTAASYLSPENLGTMDFLAIHSLRAVGNATYTISPKQDIQLRLTIPGVGFIRRHFDDGWANELTNKEERIDHLLLDDLKFDFINQTNIALNYELKIAPKSFFTADYLFEYFSRGNDGVFKKYRNGLMVGFKFIL